MLVPFLLGVARIRSARERTSSEDVRDCTGEDESMEGGRYLRPVCDASLRPIGWDAKTASTAALTGIRADLWPVIGVREVSVTKSPAEAPRNCEYVTSGGR